MLAIHLLMDTSILEVCVAKWLIPQTLDVKV